jgi:hypothetical protein
MTSSQKHIAFFLACYILLGSLLPRMDFSQLARLGSLKTHFLEHVEEAEELGESCHFTDFLFEHFITHDHHDHHEEKDCHQDMPLHGINTSISFCLSLNFQSISIDRMECTIEAPAFGSASPLPGHLSGVFQPPAFG